MGNALQGGNMLLIVENRLKLSGSKREADMNYVPPQHTTQHGLVTKPAASGKRGMVVSQGSMQTCGVCSGYGRS
jgi:hypothetical protein